MGRRHPRSRAGRARRRRERLGHEAPGAVLHGPPITVTCECGERRDLRYGESWGCERCGRQWDTRQIPAEQYATIRRLQWRFRVVPIALGVGAAALAIFFTLTGNIFSVFVLMPLTMMSWFFFVRPVHQRRYRRAIADLPRWDLHPE
jgi:hypothetical protein